MAYLPVTQGYRGQFFGARSLLASLAGLLSRPLWGRFPEGFALAFFLAFLPLGVGLLGFWLIPEPPDREAPRAPLSARLKKVFALLKKPRLRRLLFAYLLFWRFPFTR